MAATVEEGTAPKLVQVIAGKPVQIASNTGDSRKDGTNFDGGAAVDALCDRRIARPGERLQRLHIR